MGAGLLRSVSRSDEATREECTPDSANCAPHTPRAPRAPPHLPPSPAPPPSHITRAPHHSALPLPGPAPRASLFYAPQYRHGSSRSPARRERPQGAARTRRWHVPPWRSVWACGRAGVWPLTMEPRHRAPAAVEVREVRSFEVAARSRRATRRISVLRETRSRVRASPPAGRSWTRRFNAHAGEGGEFVGGLGSDW
jgi:hypothetical protein